MDWSDDEEYDSDDQYNRQRNCNIWTPEKSEQGHRLWHARALVRGVRRRSNDVVSLCVVVVDHADLRNRGSSGSDRCGCAIPTFPDELAWSDKGHGAGAGGVL